MDISELIELESQGQLPPQALSALKTAREKGLIVGNELVVKKQPSMETEQFVGSVQPPTDFQPKSSLFEKLGGKEAAEDVGGTLGGILGGLLTRNPAGAVTGAGLGGAAANQITDLFTDNIQRADTPVEQLLGQFGEAAKAGAKQSAFELIPPGLTAMRGGTVDAVSKILGTSTPEAKMLAQEAKMANVPLGAIDVTKKQFVKGSSKVLGIMPFIGAPVRKSKAAIGEALAEKSERILNDLGPHVDLEKLGVDVVKAAKNTNKEFKDTAALLYKNFESIASNDKIVPTAEWREAAKSMRKALSSGAPTLKNKKKMELLDNSDVKALLSKFSMLDDNISVPEYRFVEKQINELLKKDVLPVDTLLELKRIGKDAIKNIDVSGLPGEQGERVVKALFDANSFYSKGMKQFETATAKKLNRVDKEVFGRDIFKPGTSEADDLVRLLKQTKSPTAINNFRSLVGEDTFSEFRREWMEDAFERSMRQTKVGEDLVTEVSPQSLAKELGLFGGKLNRQVVDNLLKGSKVSPERLSRFLRLMEVSEAKFVPNPSTFLTRRIVLAGPDTLKRLFGFGATAAGAGAGAVAAGPIKMGVFFLTGRQLASILTSPKALDVLQQGIKKPPQTAQSAKAIGLRLIAAAPNAFNEKQEIPDETAQETQEP